MANDDLISRAAAKKIVSLMICAPTIKIEAEDSIDDIPAEDAAPVVHGEWKWSHGGECSECGFHNSNFDYRYCPMCGAKMYGNE